LYNHRSIFTLQLLPFIILISTNTTTLNHHHHHHPQPLQQNTQGFTPLMIAINNRSPDIVAELLEYRADVNHDHVFFTSSSGNSSEHGSGSGGASRERSNSAPVVLNSPTKSKYRDGASTDPSAGAGMVVVSESPVKGGGAGLVSAEVSPGASPSSPTLTSPIDVGVGVGAETPRPPALNTGNGGGLSGNIVYSAFSPGGGGMEMVYSNVPTIAYLAPLMLAVGSRQPQLGECVICDVFVMCL
jgi:hypothetical protein